MYLGEIPFTKAAKAAIEAGIRELRKEGILLDFEQAGEFVVVAKVSNPEALKFFEESDLFKRIISIFEGRMPAGYDVFVQF